MDKSKIKFIKSAENDSDGTSQDRARLDFSSITEHCVELTSRCIIIRSRIIKLLKSFVRDANKAKKWFIWTTIAVMIFALISITMVVKTDFKLWVGGSSGIAFATMAGLFIAASKAFGMHLQFKSLFQARWALANLETEVDQQLHLLALDTPKSEPLNEATRNKLDKLVKKWTDQLNIIMSTFGVHYGNSFSVLNIKDIIKKYIK